jgi:transcriptional regulator with XRE-family HTH domain
LLPFSRLSLTARKERRFPEAPRTFGEHLRKRRHEVGKRQRDVATELDVSPWTYLLWEQDRVRPTVGQYPALIRFLGYDPSGVPLTLGEQVKARRRALGLSQAAAAQIVGADEGTLARWEKGQGNPNRASEALQKLLATDTA